MHSRGLTTKSTTKEIMMNNGSLCFRFFTFLLAAFLLLSIASLSYAGSPVFSPHFSSLSEPSLSPVSFRALSSGNSNGRACFWADGVQFYCKGGGAGGGRGFNLAVFYPSGILQEVANFDTWGGGAVEASKLLAKLSSIPQGFLVLLSVGDDAGLRSWQANYSYFSYAENVMLALEALGSKQIRNYYYNDTWCLAAYKGAGTAIQESFSKLSSSELFFTLQMPLIEQIIGAAYGPFRDGQNPNQGAFPSRAQLQEDMPTLRRITNIIRTYSVTDGFDQIPALGKAVGLKVIPTVWVGKDLSLNNAGIVNVASISQNDNIPFLIIGSEALLRTDVTKAQLLAYINQVKQSSLLPVTTSEPWHIWRDNSDLAAAVGIICINVFPYWESQPIDKAVDYVFSRYNQIKSLYPGKRVVITETGWPTAGETRGGAVPSSANQRRFLQEFLSRAKKENIDFFLFEAFDEAWKKSSGAGEVEGHWGLYTASRQPKHEISSVSLPITTTVSAASFKGLVAPESIAALYGSDLASSTQLADSIPLPTSLANVSLQVTDSMGTTRSAPLFFVSPQQINYQIPLGTALGTATITLNKNGGSQIGFVLVSNVSPGIFTANSDGLGVPAAFIHRSRLQSDGTRKESYELVYRFDPAQNKFVPIPIDLGLSSDIVTLGLLGSGWRNRTSLSRVVATVREQFAQVSYAGPQPTLVGVDQFNITLNRNLIGRGEVGVVLQVDDQITNPVFIVIANASQ